MANFIEDYFNTKPKGRGVILRDLSKRSKKGDEEAQRKLRALNTEADRRAKLGFDPKSNAKGKDQRSNINKFTDFAADSNEALFGGMRSDAADLFEFIAPGDQSKGAEEFKRRTNDAEARARIDAPGRSIGGTFGGVQKGVLDFGSLIAGGGAVTKAAKGTNAIKGLEAGNKAARIAGAVIPEVAGGAVFSAGSTLKSAADPDKPEFGFDDAVKEFTTGAAIDAATLGLGPIARKLKSSLKGGDKAVASGIKGVDEFVDAARVGPNELPEEAVQQVDDVVENLDQADVVGKPEPGPITDRPKVALTEAEQKLSDKMISSREIANRTDRSKRDKAMEQFFDKDSGLNKFTKLIEDRTGQKLATEQNPYELKRNMAGLGGQIQQRLEGITDILSTVDDLDDARRLGVARRVLSRPDIDSVITQDEARSIVEATQAKLSEESFNRVNEVVDQTVRYHEDLLREVQQSGFFTEDAYQAIIDANGDYFAKFNVVRKMIDAESLGGAFKPSNSANISKQTVVKALKGMRETDEILDPFESLVTSTQTALKAIGQNKVFQATYDLAKQDTGGLAIMIKDVDNVAEKISLSIKNKEIRPIRNKLLRSVKTQGKQVRKLQTLVNNLNKKGLDESLKTGGKTMPEFSVAGLGGDVPTSQVGNNTTDFVAAADGTTVKNPAKEVERLSKQRDALIDESEKLAPTAQRADAQLALPADPTQAKTLRDRANAIQEKINNIQKGPANAVDGAVTDSKLGQQDTERFLRNLIEEDGTTLRSIRRQIDRKDTKMLALVDDLLDTKAEYDEVAQTIRDNTQKSIELSEADVPDGYEIVSGYVNGLQGAVAIPKEAAASYKGKTKAQSDFITGTFASVSNVFKQSVTSLSLPFAVVRNPARDFKTMAANSTTIPPQITKLVSAWVGGVGSYIFRGDGVFDAWRKAGGSGSGIYGDLGSADRVVKELQRKISGPELKTAADWLREGTRLLATPFKAIQKAGEVLEAAPRLAEFKASKAAGLSDEAAAFNSRNITVDFSQSGSIGQVMNDYVPFLNARLQGNKKLLEAAKRDPQRFARIYTTMAAMPIVTTMMWNKTQFKDVYDQIIEFEKENNFVLIFGDGQDEDGRFNQVLKFPKADLDKIFGNPLENFLDFAQGDDAASFYSTAIKTLSNLSPVDFEKDGGISYTKPLGSLPPILKAPIEAGTNKNFFFDAPIVPEKLAGLPEEYQVKDSTSSLAKGVASLTGTSPLKAENTIKGLTGSLTTANPIQQLGNTVQGVSGNQAQSRFYDIANKNRSLKAAASLEINKALEAGNMDEAKKIADEYNQSTLELFRPWAQTYSKFATDDLNRVFKEQELKLSSRSIKQRLRSIQNSK